MTAEDRIWSNGYEAGLKCAREAIERQFTGLVTAKGLIDALLHGAGVHEKVDATNDD